MKRQVNVMLEASELDEIQAVTPGIDGGPAVRFAALSFARGMQLVRIADVVGAPVAASDGAAASEGGKREI